MSFFILITTLIFTLSSVFGAPTGVDSIHHGPTTWTDHDQGLVIHNIGYQGDGVYHANFDNDGIAHIQFTPADQLNVTKASSFSPVEMEGIIFTAAQNASTFDKRQGVGPPFMRSTCEKNNGGCDDSTRPDMSAAQFKLAGFMGGLRWYDRSWLWAVSGRHLAYTCIYGRSTMSADYLLSCQGDLNKYCGEACNGFERGVQPKLSMYDVAVGRTYTGLAFCTKDFKGGF